MQCHMKGLQVLNDSEENREMLQKLPDCLTSCWNRHVTKQLRQTEEYPNFKEFADFVADEADIACNPVTYFQVLKSPEEKPPRDVKCPRANAFSTNVKTDNSDKSMAVMKTYGAVENSPVTCLCCGESHSIHKCQKLSSMPVEEKKKFIFENNKTVFWVSQEGT